MLKPAVKIDTIPLYGKALIIPWCLCHLILISGTG
jgi:hypothetical protein